MGTLCRHTRVGYLDLSWPSRLRLVRRLSHIWEIRGVASDPFPMEWTRHHGEDWHGSYSLSVAIPVVCDAQLATNQIVIPLARQGS